MKNIFSFNVIALVVLMISLSQICYSQKMSFKHPSIAMMAFVNVYSQESDSTKKKDLKKGELKKKKKKHSRLIALLLCLPLPPLYLGLLGAHRWYLKKYLTALIMTSYTIGSIAIIGLLAQFGIIASGGLVLLIFGLALVPVVIWMLIDLIRIATGHLKFEDETETEW